MVADLVLPVEALPAKKKYKYNNLGQATSNVLVKGLSES